MDYNQNERRQSSVYEQTVLAGKRKYFFDIRQTRDGDYYITMTERKKKFQSDGGEAEHERHTIFLYKEDLNKFSRAFLELRDKMKEFMPDYDFSQFDR